MKIIRELSRPSRVCHVNLKFPAIDTTIEFSVLELTNANKKYNKVWGLFALKYSRYRII